MRLGGSVTEPSSIVPALPSRTADGVSDGGGDTGNICHPHAQLRATCVALADMVPLEASSAPAV
jgi:hypothetical protein